MNSRDKALGMDRAITRRDFVGGVSVAVAAALFPGCSRQDDGRAGSSASIHPPSQLGMRGSHPGAFETAHAVVDGKRFVPQHSGDRFDLIVVGAGLSGLSAAYLYRRDVKPDARILILDNHDDFGGHAKRNEFDVDGRTVIGFGGTMLIEAPRTYPQVAAQVMRELGIDMERFGGIHHEELMTTFGMGRGCFFDKETFGQDFITTGRHGFADSLDDAPLSAAAKAELRRLYEDRQDYLAGMSTSGRRAVLDAHSYRDYLQTFAGIGDEILNFVQKLPHGVWAIGADAFPAWMALLDGYPGFAGMDVGFRHGDDDGRYDEYFRFPDGNASVARLLVRELIPDSAPGESMDDIVTARFSYQRLDQPTNTTRLRLNSTVIQLQHQDGQLDADVDVSYVQGEKAVTVTAGKVIWAGYHAMLPYICDEIPAHQTAALASSVRAPLVYTTVAIRNWQSLAKLGLRRAHCPGSFFQTVMLGHEVSIGDYRFAATPDEPTVLHLQHIPLAPGLPAPEQFRAGRRALLGMPFETFERHVRDQLGRMLGTGGFDPARDIAGIAVNRWPHGYAYSMDRDSGDVAWWPEHWRHAHRPWIDARRPIGNIAIAGTDAASNAMTESAIEEAHRAVGELLST